MHHSSALIKIGRCVIHDFCKKKKKRKVTFVLPAIKSVLEKVEQCFLHHICDLNRKREDIAFRSVLQLLFYGYLDSYLVALTLMRSFVVLNVIHDIRIITFLFYSD